MFTFFDWTYTLEGAKVLRLGLNEEQVAATKLDPNIYEEYDIKAAYTEEKDEDGNIVLSPTFEDGNSLGGALLGKKAGDTIEVEAPIGTLKYKILEIVK